MNDPIHSPPKPRSCYFKHYQLALDRITAHLERTHPNFEMEKIQEVMELLFGPRPTNTTFEGASPYIPDNQPGNGDNS
jgi:hypothetical protein